MKKQPSLVGGASIVAGVCIGAGMLALPSAGAGAWTLWTTLVLVVSMICMTFSGWLLLEAYQYYDARASFHTVVRDVLGPWGNIFNNISVYFVGGILLYAYITTLGGIFDAMWHGGRSMSSALACFVFGALVWHSARAVDRAAILLILFMLLSFFFSISGMVYRMDMGRLLDFQGDSFSHAPYALGLIPVALASFGYHHSVTSLRAYYGEERMAARAIRWGMMLTLLVYLSWIWSVFGNLPRNEFSPVMAAGGEVSVLLLILGEAVAGVSVKRALDAFALAAVLSSFIGVGLGVFDFLADFFGFDDSRLGRGKTWAVTFLPPLVLSLVAPFGFIKAIGYAGAAATVWTCMIPALLAIKIRRRQNMQGTFATPGGMATVMIVLCFGVLTAVFHVLAMWGVLPVFGAAR